MDLLAALPLRTPRLTLRPFTPEDTDAMHAYQRLPEVARYLYRPPRTRAECAATIAVAPAWERDGDRVLLAVCPARPAPGVPALAGEVSVNLRDTRARQAEIGWSLHPGAAGHGYATEAARALAAFAFTTLDAHRLHARVDTENTPSVRVCERLGMRREAHLVENDLREGEWGSEFVYGLLAREFGER
ncbi:MULTISPECIES: GNAT family N-acetyltransferase [Streptomyces]|uniref:GNAT family N-acetyltransferase n=1 Tax=Streptomyces TaxID=1883 RepID=UPI0023BA0B9A|nr:MULTISPECIES: GNAT family protein [unclassified Streptomyces]MDT0422491.1 GNAT family protein [Streptomyces sp. DSM 41859]WEH31315.1 GNAT family protein [Streptomyces sp. AM 3-1-1]